MAIVVLVLWLFTAAVGVSLLVTSNLGRPLPAEPAPSEAAPEPHPVPAPVPAAGTAAPAEHAAAAEPATKRGSRRRDRFETPSLAAARSAPMMPGLRPLLEFAHPACGLIGLGFWLGFTLVHYRALGWIAFCLIAVTACAGLAWFTANARLTANPFTSGRLIAVHGAAAAVTLTLAVLAILAIVT